MTYSKEERAVIGKAQSIKRKARQKAKADRPKNPKASRGRKREPAYLAFLRRQRCFSCLQAPPCDAAHIRMHKPGERPTGLARKPDDSRAVPLCRSCHMRQHSMSEAAFWHDLASNPFSTAAYFYSRFLAEGAK